MTSRKFFSLFGGLFLCAFILGPSFAHAGRYPSDAGILNVREAPFNAVGDGVVDDTAALRAAMEAAGSTGRIVYLPAGTYRVTDRLEPLEETYFLSVEGESRESTTIRLDANAPGYGNAAQPKAVLATVLPGRGWTNDAFMTNVVDLTIEVGAGNPGALGILYIGNNQSGIRNVTVRSLDPEGVGHTAIDMAALTIPGPGLIRNVRTEGFDYGMRLASTQYSVTLEYVEVDFPRIAGLHVRDNLLIGRKVEVRVSDSSIPAIVNANRNAMTVFLESSFHAQAPGSGAAVESQGFLYLRALSATGYAAVLNDRGTVVPSIPGEYLSHPAVSLFSTEPTGLGLPIEEIPEVPRDDPSMWINAADFGAEPGTDSTEAIRAALAATTPERGTVYLPNTGSGVYWISDTIVVDGNVRRIVGMNSRVNASAELRALEKPMFLLEDGAAEWLVFEQIFFPWGTRGFHTQFVNRRSKGTVLQHIFSTRDRLYDGREASGKTHFVDVTSGHAGDPLGVLPIMVFGPNERIWARQINPEIVDGHIANEGGTVWILGFKTEREGPIIQNRLGGRLEIIGALIHPRNIGVPPDMQVIINDQADISFVGRESNSNDASYQVIAEVRHGPEFGRLRLSDAAVPKAFDGSRISFVLPLFVERGADQSAVRGGLADIGLEPNLINLRWDPVDGATAYRVYRGVQWDGSDRTLLATVSETGYADTSAAVGSRYWYWVAPVVGGETVGLSSAFPGSTAPGLAAPPAWVTATRGDFEDRIELNWEWVQGASFYYVWRNSENDADGASRVATIPDSLTTSFTDSDVEAGQTYYYWIQPFSVGYGFGDYSAPVEGRAGGGREWAGFPYIGDTNWVETGAFLGMVYVAGDFVWSEGLFSWLHAPETLTGPEGGWVYILR